ncbi:MAG TPA: hypothetical protein DC042_14010, partial [Bacteroidales bacterium]|nr:hypothetical protein [Bacteroidales bacterium]
MKINYNLMNKFLVASLLLLNTLSCFSQNSETVHHILTVQINPATAHIAVTDSIINLVAGETEFNLNASLRPTSFSKNAKAEKMASGEKAKDVGMDRDDSRGTGSTIKLNTWKVKLTKGSGSFVVRYEGKIDFSFSGSAEDYARGFSESPGIISETGIYLAGSTYWIPAFPEKDVTYTLSTTLPTGWKTVSQGERTTEIIKGDQHIDSWSCNTPQEEVFLIGARFNEYSHKMNCGVEA